MTAAPAGTNDPIAAIFSFIPSPALGRHPSLDAYLPIGGRRLALERHEGSRSGQRDVPATPLRITDPERRRAFYEMLGAMPKASFER